MINLYMHSPSPVSILPILLSYPPVASQRDGPNEIKRPRNKKKEKKKKNGPECACVRWFSRVLLFFPAQHWNGQHATSISSPPFVYTLDFPPVFVCRADPIVWGRFDTFNLILLHHQTTRLTTTSDAKSDESDIRGARTNLGFQR